MIDHTTNGGTTSTAQTVGSGTQTFYGAGFASATTGWAWRAAA